MAANSHDVRGHPAATPAITRKDITVCAAMAMSCVRAFRAAGTGHVERGMMPGVVRILCVDDQATSRAVMVRLLAHLLSEHYDDTLIRAVPGGADAMEFLRILHRSRKTIDMVITDMHMPGMSGAELLLQLKRNAFTASVPVVVMSADALAASDERFGTTAPDLVLEKPLSRAQLPALLALLPRG